MKVLKQLTPVIAGAIIAAGAFFSGAVDNVGQAVQLAFDKEALKVECAKLVDPVEDVSPDVE